MWQPQPGWHAMPGGTGTSTVGVWRAVLGERPVAVKRLAAPAEHDPAELSDPRHFAYWRRAADVVTSGIVVGDARPARARSTPRSRRTSTASPSSRDWVEDAANSGLFAAHAIGRFAGSRPRRRPLAGPRPAPRPAGAGRAPGRLDRRWPGRRSPTSPTRSGDAATPFLDQLDALTQVPQHGDPVPANLPGREADEVVAIDWGMLGHGPVGADLGYYALSAREEFEPLLDAYLMGLPDGLATRERGRSRRPGDRRLHRLEPRRLGAGPGRRRRGCARRRSTGTRPWRRTCGRCSGSSPRSRPCWAT